MGQEEAVGVGRVAHLMKIEGKKKIRKGASGKIKRQYVKPVCPWRESVKQESSSSKVSFGKRQICRIRTVRGAG